MIIEHSPRILIVDDEASLRTVLATFLRREGYRVTAARHAQEALELLQAVYHTDSQEPFDVLISDIKMPNMDGITLLQKVVDKYEDLPVIMLTAHGTIDTAITALKMGAFDFLLKPFEREEVLISIQKAVAEGRANQRATPLLKDALGKTALVGKSSLIQHINGIIQRIADTPSTVLITGESGTGKELVAKALHENSSRAHKPFIRINCAAIPSTLIESELFGYEKGAFTGAVSSKPGRFELAHEGTLFLDEIGELPIDMQAKLLRVLQESTFERVGGIKNIAVDIRVIAATNKNLPEAIKEGSFREDLFYRLNVVPLSLPPLRERLEDIPSLIQHFTHKLNTRLMRNITGFSEEALEVLKLYPWPGNIRELENILERTILFSDHTLIEAGDLPPDIFAHIRASKKESAPENENGKPASLKDRVKKATAQIEKDLILKALLETDYNVTHTAKKLKISRKGLQLKMKELGLREEFSPIAYDTDSSQGYHAH